MGGLRAVVSMAAFIGILWSLSRTFTVPLGWFSLSFPGYIGWAAMLYAIRGAWIFPSVMAAPRYFRGEIALGGLMQTVGAFNQLQDALSFFVQSYKQPAEWCSVVERLSGFEGALERVLIQAANGDGLCRVDDGPAAHFAVEGVDLHLPSVQPLIANVNLSFQRGDTVFLGGASGAGKSTLIRAIAAIWPF